jgi:uracil-DNA glycosylase family 4
MLSFVKRFWLAIKPFWDEMSALYELYKEIALCEKCDLAQHRTRVVPGEGPEDAEIMFIGEAPGYHEDQQGIPFVGPAGKFLDQLIGSIGFSRQQVYITNVVKGRPPGNRDPLPAEITACRPWLNRQIEIIKPNIIITLGRYSMALFFPGKIISKIHGQAKEEDGTIYFPMYHPAAALHQGSLRQVIMEDMLKIPAILAESKGIPEKGKDEPPTQQMTMF